MILRRKSFSHQELQRSIASAASARVTYTAQLWSFHPQSSLRASWPRNAEMLLFFPSRLASAPVLFLPLQSTRLTPLRQASLVAQWLRLCLPMQGMWVRLLVWEIRSHRLWSMAKICLKASV